MRRRHQPPHRREAVDIAARLLVDDLHGAGREQVTFPSGAAQTLSEAGYRLHAVFSLTDLLAYWESQGSITAGQAQAVRQFLAAAG